MRTLQTYVLGACLLWLSSHAVASGPLGICAVIERIAFEPNAEAAERIQVVGAFAFYDGDVSQPRGFTSPVRGYMYFGLPTDGEAELARREWADLASVAGTGEAVAFGTYLYMGQFEHVAADARSGAGSGGYTLDMGRGVRPLAEQPSVPADYRPGDLGVVRLGAGNYDDIVAQLRSLVDR